MQLVLKSCILTLLCKYSLAAGNPWVDAFYKMMLGDEPIVGIPGVHCPPNYTLTVLHKMKEYGVLKKTIRRGTEVRLQNLSGKEDRWNGCTGVVQQRVAGTQPAQWRVRTRRPVKNYTDINALPSIATRKYRWAMKNSLKVEESKLVPLQRYAVQSSDIKFAMSQKSTEAFFFQVHFTSHGGRPLKTPVNVLGFYYKLSNGREIILQNIKQVINEGTPYFEIQYGNNVEQHKKFCCVAPTMKARKLMWDNVVQELLETHDVAECLKKNSGKIQKSICTSPE